MHGYHVKYVGFSLLQYLKRWSDPEFIASVRARIDDEQTHDVPYYNPASSVTRDGGTTHLSLLAPDGSAVSATSTVNGGYVTQDQISRYYVLDVTPG